MADTISTTSQAAILLPLGPLFERLWHEALLPCLSELGINGARVPAQFSSPGALCQLQQQIQKADFVIADITAKNPNVLYQVGYAHAAGKRVILMAQHGEDLPFAPSEYPTLIYAANSSELIRQLKEAIQTKPGAAASSTGPAPVRESSADVARAKFLSLFGDLLAEYSYAHQGGIRMENETTFILENQEMELPLVQALARRARERGIRLKLL